MNKFSALIVLGLLIQGNYMNATEKEIVCKDGVCVLKEHTTETVVTEETTTHDTAVLEATAENFADIITNNSKPVIVDFYATWCPPCKMMAPLFAELASEETDWIFASINADKAPMIMGQYGVQALPTFLVFKEGDLWGTIKGALPKDELRAKITTILSGEKPEQQAGPTQEESLQQLFMAIAQRDIQELRKLIALDIDLNGKLETPMGAYCPLQVAIINGSEEIIDILKDAGALMDDTVEQAVEQNLEHNKNLLNAIEKNLIYTQERIAALPEPIKQDVKKSGQEYSQQLMRGLGSEEAIRDCLDQGIDINTVFPLGPSETTILALVYMINKQDVLDLLIDSGATLDVEVTNERGVKQPLGDAIKEDLENYRKGITRSRERLAHALTNSAE